MSSTSSLRWRPDLRVTFLFVVVVFCVFVVFFCKEQFFRLGAEEFTLLSRFDGQHPGPEVARDANHALVPEAFCESEVQAILQWALQRQLLITDAAAHSAPVAVERSNHSPSKWNPLSIRVPLGRP